MEEARIRYGHVMGVWVYIFQFWCLGRSQRLHVTCAAAQAVIRTRVYHMYGVQYHDSMRASKIVYEAEDARSMDDVITGTRTGKSFGMFGFPEKR